MMIITMRLMIGQTEKREQWRKTMSSTATPLLASPSLAPALTVWPDLGTVLRRRWAELQLSLRLPLSMLLLLLMVVLPPALLVLLRIRKVVEALLMARYAALLRMVRSVVLLLVARLVVVLLLLNLPADLLAALWLNLLADLLAALGLVEVQPLMLPMLPRAGVECQHSLSKPLLPSERMRLGDRGRPKRKAAQEVRRKKRVFKFRTF
mmetsp:Transcript_35346/g.77055  ORF Transcript_35346/g.77055 Transcript_35346/m.77055 type:complete len:208 (-) Transcript_35346:1475-2098(-)